MSTDCSVKFIDVSEVRTASITALITEVNAPLKRLSTSTRLHGAMSQKAVIFKRI
jgi:hypothetical protein